MDHTILAVDDEENVLRALARVFRREPYRLVVANGADAGLKMIESGEHPTLVISDQRMPGMSGSEFLGRVKEILPDTIRIILTGHGDLDSAINAINDGEVFRYILKPWDDEDLKQVVRDSLERFDLIAENKALTAALSDKNKQLEELSSVLEEMVGERTRELRQKVLELEGRDRIQEHLLKVHPLDETLTTILEVLRDAVGAHRAVIHLFEESQLVPRAVLSDDRIETNPEAVASAALSPSDRERFEEILTGKVTAPPDDSDMNFGVPIIRGDATVGLIEITFSDVVGEDIVKAVYGFAKQAGIAIGDSEMNKDLDRWSSEIKDTLDDLTGT